MNVFQMELYNEAIEYLKDHTIAIPGHDGPVRRSKPAHAGHSPFAACPGSAARSIARNISAPNRQPSEKIESELRQWPVQLKLLNPAAPYFDNANLLISADCVPFAYAGFHMELLRNRIVIIFCPKLDTDIDGYIEKLVEIFSRHEIKSIMVVHMEVPCCSGVRYVVDQALEQSGKKIPVTEKTITIHGGME